jgi:hypothetical protein
MRKTNFLGKVVLSGLLCVMAFAFVSQRALAGDAHAKVVFVVT